MATFLEAPNDSTLRGYLSLEAEAIPAQVRMQFAENLSQAKAASETVTTRFFDWAWPDEFDDSRIATIALWVRAMTAFQGAVILVERGLVAEAQVLIRTGAECLFFSGALFREPGLLASMHANDERHRRTQANAIVRDGRLLARISERNAEFLHQLAAAPDGGISTLTAERAAHVAGMDDLYQFAFRGYSFTAGHATLRSLEFVTIEDGDNSGIVFGPTFAHVGQTLDTAATFFQAADALLQSLISGWGG
ncbi:DUF5677 domain-containing protein [Variovorax dokdonensis]